MKQGFTLIELIVTVTIMAVFIGTGVVVYSRTIHKNNFTRDIDTVVDMLFLAKQKTISRDVSSIPNCATFNGYLVGIDTVNNRVTLGAQCSGISPLPASYDLQHATIDETTNTSIHFVEPYGSIDTMTTIRLKYGTGVNAECMNITVAQNGIIEKDNEFFECP